MTDRKSKYKRMIEFTRDEKKEIVDMVNKCGDRSRVAQLFDTTETVVNLIYGGDRL